MKSAEDTQEGAVPPALSDLPAPLGTQRRLARTVLDPANAAAGTVKQFTGTVHIPFDTGLILELETQIAAIKEGKSERMAEILAGQIETLNAMFYGLVGSVYEYRGHPYQEEKLKLAMRVQSRCVSTIQALTDLKNPRPVAYVQQANIGNAVQVNNNAGVTEGVENPPNELLEKQHNEWLDRRTPSTTVDADQELDAVGQIHRTKDGSR